MNEALTIWVVGNLVLPMIPVVAVLAANWFAGRQATVSAVLGDGVLFFYSAAANAALMMDFWKDRIAKTPKADPSLATLVFLFALLLLITASGAYFFTALARVGVVDRDGRPFDLSKMSTLSWQSAVGVSIFCFLVRGATGVY